MNEFIPYLACEPARTAISWYCHVFAAVCSELIADGPERVAHAELNIGQSRFFVSSVYEDHHLHDPRTQTSVASAVAVVCTTIANPLARALTTGATLLRPVEVGRYAKFRDPFGHIWFLNQVSLTHDKTEE